MDLMFLQVTISAFLMLGIMCLDQECYIHVSKN